MTKKRRRGFCAHLKGLECLEEKRLELNLTYEQIQEKAQQDSPNAKLASVDQVKRFFHPEWGKKIEKVNVESICKVLGLNPTDIVEDWIPEAQKKEITTPEIFLKDNLSKSRRLLEIKEHCKNNYQLKKYSQIRLLGGRYSDIYDLYVDIYAIDRPEKNIGSPSFEKLENTKKRSRYKLIDKNSEKYKIEELIETRQIIEIIGKPGFGKSTLIKYLVSLWCKNFIFFDKTLVLLEARDLEGGSLHLFFKSVSQKLNIHKSEFNIFWEKWEVLIKKKKEREEILERSLDDSAYEKEEEEEEKGDIEIEISNLKEELDDTFFGFILRKGLLILLIDGVDEMPSNNIRQQFKNSIDIFTNNYPNIFLLLTCRTQTLDFLNPIEILGFEELPEIELFFYNWHKCNGYSQEETKEIWKTFKISLDDSPELLNLASTPLQLNLICLVLSDGNQIPKDKEMLYEKSLHMLLQQWNEDKQIQNWSFGKKKYRNMSLNDKENLLSEIAYSQLKNPENFSLYKQNEITQFISSLLNLHNLNDSLNILHAIEQQHGIFVERAKKWSFLYFVFQEYYLVKRLRTLSKKVLKEELRNELWRSRLRSLWTSQGIDLNLFKFIQKISDEEISIDSNILDFINYIKQKSKSKNLEDQLLRKYIYIILFSKISDRFTLHENPEVYSIKTSLKIKEDKTMRMDMTLLSILSMALSQNSSFTSLIAKIELLIESQWDDLMTEQFKQSLIKLNILLLENQNQINFQEWRIITGDIWIKNFKDIIQKYRNIRSDFCFSESQKETLNFYQEMYLFLLESSIMCNSSLESLFDS